MGLYFFIYDSRDVAQCETSDQVIESRASDVTYLEGVRGDILLDDNSINQRLISTVYQGVVTVEIECTRWTLGFITIV